VNVEGEAIWDFAGELQEWVFEPGAEVQFAGQTEIGVRHWNRFERFEGQDFRRYTTAMFFRSEWLSWLNLGSSLEWGTEINYYPAPGLRPFLGDARSAEVELTLKPVPRLRLDQSYLYSRLATDGEGAGCGCSGAPGEVFTNHILRTRASFQFTRRLSLRAILDYEAVLPDPDLVDLEREKRFGADILVTYLVNPWTALYVGYNDAYANWAIESLTDRPVGLTDSARTNVGRQVFVKISYLFRY
jgi:hypothetical protein